MQGAVVPVVNVSEGGIADTHRVLQHGGKHRLHITRRTADHLEHFRGRSLLLQRIGEVSSTLAQFVQKPRILDGDDSLSCEVGD